jgi:hypothetical protein
MKYLEKKTKKGFEYRSFSMERTEKGEKVEAEVIMNSEIKLPPQVLDLVFTTLRKQKQNKGTIEVAEYKGEDLQFPGAKVDYKWKAPQWGNEKEKLNLKLK